MAGIIFRGLLGNSSGGGGGGGGGGGCGVVLATPYDDNFDCNTVLDTTGARFSGAYSWTDTPAVSYSGATQSGGQLLMSASSTGVWSAFGPYQAIQAADLAADWAFETTCARDAAGGFLPGVGLRFVESATSKTLHAIFTDDFGTKFYVGNDSGINTFGGGAVAAIGGKLEVARISGNIRVRYDIGSGWVTAVASLAQTTPFTTRPDIVQCMVAPRRNSFSTSTTHDYFYRTA